MGTRETLAGRGRQLRRQWEVLLDRGKLTVLGDPRTGCPIGWKPSVFAPVFYGYRDTVATIPPVLDPGPFAAAAPVAGDLRPELEPFGHPVRVWYPSLDGSPQHAEILRGCGRYPLVILAHGSCPRDEDHYRLWFELPAVLARSGYVVVVPDLQLGAPSGNETEQRLIGRLATWARSEWQHRDLVMPAPATALVGHSWGAGLLGHVLEDAPGAYAAYVSLSGVEVPGGALRASVPRLFAWGDDDDLEVLTVPISQWEDLPPPAHVARFHHAGHWDYLPAGRSACDAHEDGRPARGTCTLTPLLAAGVVACFLTRYLRPEGVPVVSWGPITFFLIHPSLRPPSSYPHYLTTEQQFYAGGHLTAWKAVPSREDCGVTLSWMLDSGSGELVHS